MAADNSAGGAGFDWGGFLSGLESTAVNIAKTVSAPTGVQYNPATGIYQPIPGTPQATTATIQSTLGGNTGLLLLLGFGLVALLLVRR